MAVITFVTTLYNRISSATLHLESLKLQQDTQPFSVIAVDDGSSQDIFGLCMKYRKDLDMMYYWQPHGDPLLGIRARNQGCRIVPSKTTHIWLTDGDIVFNPQAVQNAYKHLEERPDIIYGGRYDWMPKMTVTADDLKYRWDAFVNCTLPRERMATFQGGRAGRPRNLDPRTKWGDCYKEYKCGGGLLGSNVIIPVKAFRESGGYDENMPPACNAGDCEFGFHLGTLDYKISLCDCIRGYHLYHDRDQLQLTLGVRKGIKYMHDKYPEQGKFDPTWMIPKLPPGVTDEFSKAEKGPQIAPKPGQKHV